MTDMIIGPPPESWWGRMSRTIKLHPVVAAALVAGILGILGLWFGSRLEAPWLRKRVTSLEAKLTEKDAAIRARDTEIQRLETLLTPFRTIALERFTGSEQEALRELADQISALQTSDTQKSARIETLSQELRATRAEAAPPKLLLKSQQVTTNANGYTTILRFETSKPERLGLLVFAARVVNDTPAEILDFWPTGRWNFECGPDSKKITPDRKQARLIYSHIGGGNTPEVQLTTSAEGTILVSGNYGLEPFLVDIKKAEP